MRKTYIFALLIFTVLSVNAQKYQTGLVMTDKHREMVKNLEEFVPQSSGLKSTEEVRFIDNSATKYFPPVIYQVGGSCAFASSLGYIYNYELNALLDRAYDEKYNCNYMNIWNYINKGDSYQGGYPLDAWALVKDNGIAFSSEFPTKLHTEWPHGYDVIYHGMSNRVNDVKVVRFGASTALKNESIQTLKRFLLDHGDGSKNGGLVSFITRVTDLKRKPYEGKSNTGYNTIVKKFPAKGPHAMTLVGFDDDIEYDINNDGSISENEKGAFICINTWGVNWGDNGRFYIPYELFRIPISQGGVGYNNRNDCYMVFPKHVTPKLVFKVVLKHSSRNDIHFKIGASNGVDKLTPEFVIDKKVMKSQGGDFPMKGIDADESDVIELALDASELLTNVIDPENTTYFLDIINATKDEQGNGQLLSCSLMSYMDEDPVEYICMCKNSKLNYTSTARASVNLSNINSFKHKDVFISYGFDDYTKEIVIQHNSKIATKLYASILDMEGVQIESFEYDIPAGAGKKRIKISGHSGKAFYLKINTANTFIYKKLIQH